MFQKQKIIIALHARIFIYFLMSAPNTTSVLIEISSSLLLLLFFSFASLYSLFQSNYITCLCLV